VKDPKKIQEEKARLERRRCQAPIGIEEEEDDEHFCDLYEASEQAKPCAGTCAYLREQPEP